MYNKLTSSNFITFVNTYPEHLNGKNRFYVAAAFIAKVLGVKVAQVAISSELFSCKSKRVGQSPLPAWLVNFMQKDGLFQCPNALAAKNVPAVVVKVVAEAPRQWEQDEMDLIAAGSPLISSKALALLETQSKELLLPNIA